MPKWLDTRGNTKLSIAVCDRCKMKRAYVDLAPDPNFPGLRVCNEGCRDQYDPYRLPARQTERINIRFARPDVSVATNPHDLDTGGYGGYVISTEGNTNIVQNDGNLDGLLVTPIPTENENG